MTNTLNSAQLHPLGLERALPTGNFPPETNDLDRYDRQTFWIDAFHNRRTVTLLCPKLRGLDDLISGAKYYLDELPVQPVKINRFRRYDCIILPSRRLPSQLRVEYNGKSCASPVSDGVSDQKAFASKNVMVTLSKNDPLTAIADWALYHREVHGAEAIVFFDNGSTIHTPTQVQKALEETGVQARVFSVPSPFGLILRHAKGGRNFDSEMLQTALLNLARLRFFPRARAVLQCDIDELVWCEKGSIFDAAVWSPTGFVQMGSLWRYAAPDLAGHRHQDHYYWRDAPSHCRGKYCLRPGRWGALGSWGVHTLETLPRRSDKQRKRAGIWHCAGISSSYWVGSRNKERQDLIKDMKAEQALKSVFSDRPYNPPIEQTNAHSASVTG